MTDPRELFSPDSDEVRLPELAPLWARGRRRRLRHRAVGVGVVAAVALLAGFAWSLASGGDAEQTLAAGTGAAQTVRVIPRFLDEAVEVLEIRTEVPAAPESEAFEQPERPGVLVLVSSAVEGVFEDSGRRVTLGDVAGFVRTDTQGLRDVVSVEWKVDGLWNVFQARGLSEAETVALARSVRGAGTGALTDQGFELAPEEPWRPETTVITSLGALLFVDTEGQRSEGVVAAQANGFTAYRLPGGGDQLFVDFEGRMVFSIVGEAYPAAAVVNGLDVASEQEWIDWLDLLAERVPSSASDQSLDDALTFQLSIVNQTGAQHLSLSDFVELSERACGGAVNDQDQLLELGAGVGGFASPEVAAGSIWLAARQVCPENFADQNFESGPPFGAGEATTRPPASVQVQGLPEGFPDFIDLSVLDETTSSWVDGQQLVLWSTTALSAVEAVEYFGSSFPSTWTVNNVLGPVVGPNGLTRWSIDVDGNGWTGVVDIAGGDFGDPVRNTMVTIVFAAV